MLAKRRGFYAGDKEVIRTPLLLPSFSSKGFPAINKIFQTMQEVIDGEVLISAYDLHHDLLKGSFDFAQAIFLDSGGYEASKDIELSEDREKEYEPKVWTQEEYRSVLSGWSSNRPTVFVSYDHPDHRLTTSDQIDRADTSLPIGSNVFREILFKPETKEECEINISAVLENIHRLSSFDAIGVTEKEIGQNLQSRMVNIARIRQALITAGLDKKPIHVFGSLDTISTPLFFVAGADIFDGLTWLRYAYHEGLTIYRQNFAVLNHGTGTRSDLGEALCLKSNYLYLKELTIEMKGFLRDQSFDNFKYHSKLIERAYNGVMEEIGG